MRIAYAFLCLFLLASALPSTAQPNPETKIDKIIAQAMTKEGFPGMEVAVVRQGKVVFKKAYGVKAEGSDEKTDENTIFSIGSVSKAFTGIGIMLLVQNGKVALDDPIKKYMKNLPDAWGNITIRQYMTHTSGIPELKGIKDDGSFDESIKIAVSRPMSFSPPGKRQQYNNFNFAVMGKLIETVSGLTYLDFMDKYIFHPVQMTRTGLNPNAENVAMGHMLNKNGKWKLIKTHFQPGDYGLSSGGLQTTLTDFIRLSQALTGTSLLNKKTEDAMWTPYSPRLSNTPGWHSRQGASGIVIHKGGGGTGIGSVCDFTIVPSQNLYVVVMANKDKNQISPSAISNDILKECYGIPDDGKGPDDGEGN
jgi:CubicO group peptidase (beta-lactamase class C family)